MKTEKKSSEPSCVPPVVVKEESESGDCNRVKIKEESGQGNNEEGVPGEDTTESLKDAALEAANVDTTIGGPGDTQNGSGSQGILNSIKSETDPLSAVDELPPDCGTNVGLSSDPMQPLSSNLLSKQMGSSTNTGEAQYMQQQSQIFVFSTHMANKGAEMVLSNQFPTIIAFHMAQPSTKKFLEKHPNKMPHFRPNPPQWLNNFTGMKQKGHQHSPNMGFPGEQPPDLPPLDPNDPAFWNDQANMRNLNGSNPMGNSESSLDDPNLNVPCLVPNSSSNSVNPQHVGSSTIGHSPNLMGGTTSPGPGGVQPSLQGKKIPNENLTPQQLAHREEQLAVIAKLRQQIFEPKDLAVGGMDPTRGPPGSHCPTNLPPENNPNQCGSATMDWQKLQHGFMDGKNKAGVGSPGMPVRQCGTTAGGMIPSGGGPGSVGPASGPLSQANPALTPASGGRPGTQGPPPPYHQTTRSASVPIAVQSPNPASPNNPTSNLSLPSPRASSALNSPADCNRQFQLTNAGGPTGPRSAGHLPGQSPTSQDSPNPATVGSTGASTSRLNCSNPGTPVSHGHLSALSPSSTPQKDPSSLDFPSNQTSNVESMFSRTLTSITLQKQQQQQQLGSGGQGKELMPVPSPQLAYLNTFDNQELTIQKQPNTSVKEPNLPGNTQANNPEMGNRMLAGNMESSNGAPGNSQFGQRSEVSSPSIDNANRGFGGSLHSPHTPLTPHTPGSVAPHTPVDAGKSGNKTQSAQSSPASHNTSLTDTGMGPPRTIPASPNTKSESSPSSKDLQQQQQQQQQPNLSGVVPGQGNNQGNIPGGMISTMVNVGGNAPFGCGRPTTNVSQPNDNMPLNPNNIGNRMTGLGPMSSNSFDPITSLAQMSQQLTNTAASNVLGNDNSPMHAGNAQGMMPFNHPNMHMMQMQQQQQGMNEMNGCHMGTGAPNATNETGSSSNLCMGLGGPATSYSPTPHTGSPGVPNKMGHPMMSHGIMTTGVGGPQGPGNSNVNVSQSGAYPSGPGPGIMGPEGSQNRLGMPNQIPHQTQSPHHQQQIVHGPGGPYNGANVQVKPSAPNTIQYLPARPNVGHAPRAPPSLDFLQRFANPMTGIDTNKMNSPSVNLQYFPGNGCVPTNMAPGPGAGPGPQGLPHGNMSGPGPGPGSIPPNMGGTVQPGMGVPPQGHMHPSMRPVTGGPGSQGPGMRPQPNIIRMQHMAGGNLFPGNTMDPDKVFPPDIVSGQQMTGQTGSPGMYGVPPLGPNQKQSNPMSQLGPPPDASQPLPPSMGAGGTGPNFKNSPFMGGGPSMSDPNYAQQYHNFQQQLYATGTRGNNGPPGHPGIHNQPNTHQQFFMPK